MAGQCEASDCEREVHARSLCRKHYSRALDHGTIDVRPTRYRVGICIVEDCESPDRGAHCLCNKHHKRMLRHGSTDSLRPDRPRFRWMGDNIAYISVHARLRRARGSASSYLCIDCGEAAKHWSYRNGCESEMVDEGGRHYCPHVEHYDARCWHCHKSFDQRWSAIRALC